MRHSQKRKATNLVKILDEEIRSRGRGSIRAAEKAVGHCQGWWQHRAESGDITVHQMLKLLEHLGLDPVAFVRRAFRTGPSFELDCPRGEPPKIVEKARARFHSTRDAKGVGLTYLETLDRQRDTEPEEVIRLAEWAVAHVEREFLARLLGVVGSSYRMLFQLDQAEHAIQAGIEIAEASGDRLEIGCLLQRQAYIASDRGEQQRALRLVDKAAVLFLRLADRYAVGKALVDQGRWLYYLEQPEEAIGALRSALEYLPDGPSRNRCTAYQSLGFAFVRLGDLDTALENVRAAQEASRPCNDGDRAKILWLRARIHSDLGEFDEAAALLKTVISTFRTIHHGEVALATCELVRVQLLSGQAARAYSTATRMRVLMEPLRHHKIISAAIAELLRSGQEGLTLALVQRAMARIEDERQQRSLWLTLRVRSQRP